MDLTWQYLWAAGYGLPPNTFSTPAIKIVDPLKRRGKKAARNRRQRAHPRVAG